MVNKKYAPYLFLIPFFTIFILFFIYPILSSLYLSFTETIGSSSRFIGFENYINVLKDRTFWKSLSNVLIIYLFRLPILLFLSTTLAVILNNKDLKFRALFRLLVFLPVLIDLVTYSIIFSLLFNENFGIINYILELIGFSKVLWISRAIPAKMLIMIAMTWRWTGYNTVIVLAGLQQIDEGLYEAADIEGASPITKFFRITIPLLKPVLLFITIMSTIGTIQIFAEPTILTTGGPGNETLTPIMYLYEYGFNSFKFGYASAVAYIITTIVFVISVIQIKLTKGVE